MAAMGLQETYPFLITIVVSVLCVRVCLGRELIIPGLGVDYSDLWDTVVKNSSAPSSHLNPRHGDRVMYMCAAEPAVPQPPPPLCHTVWCNKCSHWAALLCFYRWSINVPSSLQSLLFPCETQHSEIPSSINSLRFNPTGQQGLRTAVCTLHKRETERTQEGERPWFLLAHYRKAD